MKVTACDLCHKETEVDKMELRYVATKADFFNICDKCRQRLVTYSPEEWNGPDGTVTIC